MAGWSEHYRAVLLALLVLILIAGLALFYALRPKPEAPLFLALTPAPTPEATPTPGPIRVYVSGAVQRPDVYLLPAGSIVKDALLAAGGASDDADLDRINLASPLADGQQVYIPRTGEGRLPAPLSPEGSGSGKVNVNTASATELEALPSIGPATAQAIIEYRQTHGPFHEVDDIEEVPGIGPATLDKIRELITTD